MGMIARQYCSDHGVLYYLHHLQMHSQKHRAWTMHYETPLGAARAAVRLLCLQVMRVIEHVQPRFITIEEVAFFLMHRIVKKKGSSGRVQL